MSSETQFNELVDKILAKEPKAIRFCVKHQKMIPIQTLKTAGCPKCDEFVCNGGICDPI